MQKFNNILVVRTDRIGDVVLTIPALRALKKAYPLARITVWSSAVTRPLLDGLPFVNEVIVEETQRGWAGYVDLVKELRGNLFDLAIVYHTKRRTNAACFLAGISRRLGYDNGKFGFLLTDPVRDSRMLGEKHEALYCLDLLNDIHVSDQDTRLELPFHKDAEAWAANFFFDQKLMGHPVVVIHPSASCPTRRWPAESYGELADAFIRHCRVRVMVVGDATAASMAAVITRRAGGSVIDLTGQLSLPQLASVARRCRLFISTDSGPVHIAAAVDAQVAVLFLRNQPGINPERWCPLGRKVLLFQNKPGEEIVIGENGQVVSGRYDSITPDEIFLKTAPLLVH